MKRSIETLLKESIRVNKEYLLQNPKSRVAKQNIESYEIALTKLINHKN